MLQVVANPLDLAKPPRLRWLSSRERSVPEGDQKLAELRDLPEKVIQIAGERRRQLWVHATECA
jgi:hypothetical protein